MILTELTVSGLRCIEHAELEIPPGLALVCGDNGSGKTSLLEASFLLGRGRSFRTRNSERLIRHGRTKLTFFRRSDGVPPHAVGGQVSRTARTTARISGATAGSLTELSEAFPVQVIDPGVHK